MIHDEFSAEKAYFFMALSGMENYVNEEMEKIFASSGNHRNGIVRGFQCHNNMITFVCGFFNDKLSKKFMNLIKKIKM